MSMDSLIIEIHNQHVAGSGFPPSMMKRANDDFYCSYFESACGDQWLFIFNRQTFIGYFWSGDIGWDRRIEIRDNKIQDADLILGPDEFGWLTLCWRVASGGVELETLAVHEMQGWVKTQEKRKRKRKKKKAKKRVATKR